MMDRKTFLKTCGFACAGGAFSSLFSACGSANYFAKNTLLDNQIAIKKSEFFKVEKDKTVARKFVLVTVQKFSYPICIYKFSEDDFSALLLRCTHKSCELNPQGNYLVCPCHGSEFTNRGEVQNPPAEQNLQSFTIKTDAENVFVQL